MNTTKRNRDPFGRANFARAYLLQAVALTLAITGSAWPSWARSGRASVDTPRDSLNIQDLESAPECRSAPGVPVSPLPPATTANPPLAASPCTRR